MCSYYINGSKNTKFIPISTIVKNIDLEQRLEKKLNDFKSFNNHTNNIKEMITYFKDKNNKSKKRNKNHKTLNTKSESVDSFFLIGATSTSIFVSITGIGLIVLPLSAGIACTLSLSNKVTSKKIINKYNIYKKQNEKYQQLNLLITCTENLHKIMYLIKVNKKVFALIFLITWIKKKKFLENMNIKFKSNFFSNNMVKFQPGT